MILDYYAGLSSTFAFDTVQDGLMGPVLVTKEPVGVVAAITPWNVPLFLACAKLAPALLSGSTVVFKPAPETPLDANLLAEIFAEAGLPKGVLNVVPAGREVGAHLVSHPGRGQGLLHRVDGGRSGHRGSLRPEPQAGQPRAGRQVGRHPAGRRGPGRVPPAAAAQRHHEQRGGLHLPDPHPGPPRTATARSPMRWSSRSGP